MSDIDLLKNRDSDAKLGPFDGRVGAVIQMGGASFFITSNARYIPGLPITHENKIFIRADMWYGPDDPTLWPQAYSSAFCHLGTIPKKPTSEKKIKEHGIMWWDPTPADFVSLDMGRSIIRGLGKLSTPQFSRLAQPTNTLIEEYKVYAKSIPPPGKVISLFPALVQTLSLGLERLQTLPSTYSKMVLGVINLQHAYLELHGLLSYMTIYKPRMEDPNAVSALPDGCVGVYTSDPTVAQQFRIARLPYWFIRPMLAFKHENILSIATPLDPAAELQLEPAVGYPVITVGATTEDKMRALPLHATLRDEELPSGFLYS
ncbi:hypothetical protein B0H10DRAFT_2207256 [Mycena sp. CBHHK59/15]|nr:hypothetical protein B0H10DRAFT_2207256 [Mycena sp. CBHHK59/15]